jgi:uncharacterized spore protein YtfJ
MAVDISTLLAQVRDSMTVKRVFGDPIERDGVMLIPVANVMGAFGAGAGNPPSSAGGGFGVRATPAGMYVVDHGRVRWEPALNLNAVILGGQIVAIVLLLTLRRLMSVAAERRSTRLPAMRPLRSRGAHERLWSRPLRLVSRG